MSSSLIKKKKNTLKLKGRKLGEKLLWAKMTMTPSKKNDRDFFLRVNK